MLLRHQRGSSDKFYRLAVGFELAGHRFDVPLDRLSPGMTELLSIDAWAEVAANNILGAASEGAIARTLGCPPSGVRAELERLLRRADDSRKILAVYSWGRWGSAGQVKTEEPFSAATTPRMAIINRAVGLLRQKASEKQSKGYEIERSSLRGSITPAPAQSAPTGRVMPDGSLRPISAQTEPRVVGRYTSPSAAAQATDTLAKAAALLNGGGEEDTWLI